jgi:hypothetical protein
MKTQDVLNLLIPILPLTLEFFFVYSSRFDLKMTQGGTYPSIIVDMRALTQRHTYVGMSRTTHLDHLWLSGQNSFLSENKRKNRGVRKEQIRKLALERRRRTN